MKYTIGEFSRMTALSIKSLRLYHEKEILIPAEIDEFSGYRYYNDANYERARSIKILRNFDFSLAEIREILDECDDESRILNHLEQKLKELGDKIHRYKTISHSIESIITFEREMIMKKDENFVVEEKQLDTILIAGHRMKGRYDEIGKGLGLVCRKMGRHINGNPMTLYYDPDYKENDADFEPCVPVRKGKDEEGISVRELKGGTCISLIHKGTYDQLGNSYKKVFAYIKEKGYKALIPSREVYIKGPGIILKGNPKNYLTEIQVLVEK